MNDRSLDDLAQYLNRFYAENFKVKAIPMDTCMELGRVLSIAKSRFPLKGPPGKGKGFATWINANLNFSRRTAGNYIALFEGNPRRRKEKIPSLIRWTVWERDDFTCFYCGSRKFLEIDHVTPESMGGETSPENLITACKPCNIKKGDRPLIEIGA